MTRTRIGLVARYVVLTILAAAFLLPFYVMFRNAFSTQAWILAPQWNWLPNQLDGTNIASVLGNENLGIARALGMSALISIVQTAGTIVISMLAGYGLARWDTRAARIVGALTVFTLMVPTTITFVPMFVMVSSLGWISTLRGLIVPGLFSAFATYLFRSAFVDFPKELEEAAAIDGANPWTTFWRVVFPNTLGMVAAVGTITFIGSWNAFLWPNLIAQDPALRPVQVMLSQYMTAQGAKYPEMFAGALIAVAPVLVVFVFLQRYLVQGVTASGLK